MPRSPRKRKSEVEVTVENNASDSEVAAESPEETAEPEVKKPIRGRGRPRLSDEERAKREAKKKASAGRGRGRPKGTGKKAEDKK